VAPRAGIHKQDVIAMAAELLAQRNNVDELPLRDIAERLGVRTQSLYAHVDGIDGLRRELALRGLTEMAAAMSEAAIGRSGAAAVDAIIRAWLSYAERKPGLYSATVQPAGDDVGLAEATAAAMRPLQLVLRSYGLDPHQVVHWHRLILATIHGFAALQRQGVLTLPEPPASTVDHMVAVFVNELERQRPTTT
jgi:AcrR family transcriptional regulator